MARVIDVVEETYYASPRLSVKQVLNAGMAHEGESIDVSASDETLTIPGSLFVGTQGDVKVDFKSSGTAIVLKNVVGFLPIMVSKVYTADTTADDIVVLR